MATLLHHWKLDENTGTSSVDQAGNTDLELNVVGSYPAWVEGKFGSALSFSGVNGSGSRFVLASNDVAWLETRTVACGRAFSFCGWIKVSDNEHARPIISTWQDSTGNGALQALYLGIDGKIYFSVLHVKVSTGYLRYAGSTSVVDDGQWHFVVGTYDGGATDGADKVISVYVDGSLDGTYTETDDTIGYDDNGISKTVLPILVGGGSVWADTSTSINYPSTKIDPPQFIDGAWYYGYPYGSFDGLVDDPRIYCGALTAEEVEDLYNESYPSISNAIMFSCNT